jgi:immunoglobulin-binding protein 1
LKSFESKPGDDQSETRAAHARASGAAETAGKKPFIITRDAIQAQVFGAGYPSLPVYSIGQFYDQLADKGMMPKGDEKHKGPVQIGGGVTENQKEEEKAEKDLLEDRDDEEELRKKREWDEFKDENKRGSGNRFNRS